MKTVLSLGSIQKHFETSRNAEIPLHYITQKERELQLVFVKGVHREENLTYEIIQKLCKLGDLRPNSCMKEAENMPSISIPKIQKETRLLVLAVSFQVAFELFKNDTSSSDWDSKELQKLQDLLDQQTKFYRNINPGASSSDVGNVQQWRTFWSRLTSYLAEKDFGTCAWESTRSMILSVMSTFYKVRRHMTRPPRCF